MILNIAYTLTSCANFFFGKKEKLPLKTDEIKTLIENASNVYGWFERESLPVDKNVHEQYDGKDWYKVKDDKYNTFFKMDEYLMSIFSRQLSDSLWCKKRYRVFNEVLYSLGTGREVNNSIKDIKYKLGGRTKKRITYQVTVTYASNNKKRNQNKFYFTYKKINGKWVFTEFSYFY
jgi:hypothetical protein